jgi:hypothetical protein
MEEKSLRIPFIAFLLDLCGAVIDIGKSCQNIKNLESQATIYLKNGNEANLKKCENFH